MRRCAWRCRDRHLSRKPDLFLNAWLHQRCQTVRAGHCDDRASACSKNLCQTADPRRAANEKEGVAGLILRHNGAGGRSKRSRSIIEVLGVADGYIRWAKPLTLARATGQSGEHLPPEDTLLFWPAPKIALLRHRIRKSSPVGFLRHFDRAERSKMRRHELRVEQAEPAFRQTRDEMRQGDFRGAGLAVKHAFAEKRRAEVDAVEPANKRAIRPALHGVAPAGIEELAIEQPNPAIDPCLFASSMGGGASVDHGIEIAIDSDFETIGADCLGETLRYDQAIERENAAHFRIDPEKILVEGALRHRKQADGIGAEQNVAGY